MNKKSIVVAAALALGLTGACIIVVGEGTDRWDWDDVHVQGASSSQLTETRELPAFRHLRVRGATDVELQLGSPQSVTVRGREDLVERVTTEVVDDTLVVALDGDWTGKSPRLAIVVPELASAAVEGSADLSLEGFAGGRLALAISGSGDVRATGRVEHVEARVTGSGDLHLARLRAAQARVEILGSGDAHLWVDEALDVRISGSGDVRYRGDPRLTREVAGSGSVSRE